MLTFSVLSVVNLQYNCCSVCWVLAWGGAEQVTSPLRAGVSEGSPTAPLISLHKIEKAGIRLCKKSFSDFLVVTSGSFFFKIKNYFFPPDNESRILPHVFKSMQNVKSLLAWVSEMFWFSGRDTNAAASCCCWFCVAISSGGDVYFCNNIDNIYSWLMFCRGICCLLIYIAFCSARWNRIMFHIPKLCCFVHSSPAFTSPFYLAFLFSPSFSFHFPLIFHHDVVNSFFQLMLHFVLSIAMWQKSQRHSMSGSTPPGTSFELS